MNNTEQPWWAPTPTTAPGTLLKGKRRKIFVGILTVAIAAGLLGTGTVNPGRDSITGPAGQVTLAPTMQALSLGCGGITTWPSAPDDEIGYIDATSVPLARIAPPVSGNFDKRTWTGKNIVNPNAVIVPSPGEALGLQYRGWTVVWYRQDANPKIIHDLLVIGNALPTDAKVLIAPWPLDAATTWKPGRVIIIAGWNTTQACLGMNNDILTEFQAALPPALGADVPLDASGPKARTITLHI